MVKQQKSSTKSNRNKFVLIAIGVAIVVIGIGIAISMQNSVSPPENNSRTVNWRHVHGLGIDPSDHSILYIATHGDFYQSIDGAPPFKVDKDRADYMAFNAPLNKGSPLYASGHPSTGGNTGLIKSTDGGRTWERVSNVLDPPVDFHAMAVSKNDPDLILGFDSGGRGLFRTTDAGKTWEKLEYPDYVTALAISLKDSEIVFAGTGKGIYQSNDGAKSWIQLDQYKGITIHALSFDEEGVLYASTEFFGLKRSSDLGKTWVKISSPALTITSIAIDSHNNIIYVAGYSPEGFQEVFKSSDEKKWELIGTNRGL